LALCLPLMKCWTSLMPLHPRAEFAQAHHKPGQARQGRRFSGGEAAAVSISFGRHPSRCLPGVVVIERR
jgi:hypothetical protein